MSDDLMERLLAREQDQLAHPDEYRFILICRDCGLEQSKPCSKEEVLKARERAGLAPGVLVRIKGHCAKCSPDEEDE